MSFADDLILSLCRAERWESGLAGMDLASLDGEELLETAELHRVAPLVLARLRELDLEGELGRWVAERDRRAFLAAAGAKAELRSSLTRALAALRTAGVEPLLLKGFSLDFDGLRQFGDLDLLVRELELPRSLEALAERGFEFIGDRINHHVRASERGDLAKQLSWNNQFQVRDTRNGVLVELHTALFERSRAHSLDLDGLRDRVGDWFEHRVWDEQLDCHVSTPEYMSLTIALYASVKYSPAQENLRLRTFVDLDRLVRRGVDWDEVLCAARKGRVSVHLAFSLTVAQRLLGTPVPEAVVDAARRGCGTSERLALRLHLASVGDLRCRALLPSVAYRATTPFLLGRRWTDRLRWLVLQPLLFPPRRRIEASFGLREGSPWAVPAYLLNPLRWVLLAVRRRAR